MAEAEARLGAAKHHLDAAKEHLAEHGANMDTDVKVAPEHYKDTQKYVESWAEWDVQSCSSSDVAMGDECDVVIDDVVMVGSDFSGANTQPACSSTSASSLPLSIAFPAGAESNSQLAEAACICVHAEAVECGGLDMRELKEAMVKESAVQEPLVSIIGILLDKTVARNDSLQRVSNLQDFENHRKCTLTASAYLSRMMRYGACSPSCAVVGVMYLQRLKTKDPTICVTSYNLQRLLLVSVMVAHNYLDDLYYSNKHWARIGGVTVQEINHLEATVLQLLDWKMHVSREEYLEYLEGLGCGPRGSITDTDSWANDLKQLQELLEQGEGARLHDQAHHEHRSDAFQAPQLPTPVAIEPSPSYAMYLESQQTHTQISP
jgi:predicted transcriptional regulator